MKISTKKKNKKEMKKGTSFFSFKLIHRSIWVIYCGLSLFVSPMFLLALIPLAIILFFSLVGVGGWNYLQWKKALNGKSDRHLTFRKLMYVIEKCQKHNLAKASFGKDYSGFCSHGTIYINEKIKIKLKKEEFKLFQATILYENEKIETVKGLSFQKIKWDLEEFPDILEELHQFFDKFESIVQNKNQMLTEKEMKRKQDLIQRVKEDYNRL